MIALNLGYLISCCRDVNKCKLIIKEQGAQILYTVDQKGHSPLHWAALAGYNDIVKYFIECNAPVNKESNNELAPKPIHWACVNGHIVTVDILLQNGASIDVTDNRNCTPLIISAQYGKTMLAGYLIGKGARKDLTDIDGDTALHWAAFKGNSDFITNCVPQANRLKSERVVSIRGVTPATKNWIGLSKELCPERYTQPFLHHFCL